MVRTRFAPSPTGFMHVGGVRTALFAWLVARQAGGQFLIRIEDTDRSRHVEESEKQIIDSLKWLGISSDQPIVRQSDRLEIYRDWGQKLIDMGRAYADPTDEKELDRLRAEAKAAKKPFLYRNYRPTSPLQWQEGVPLRFKSEPKSYKWNDAVLGELSSGQETIDDFIIIKSDGFPTYNFAHIIDDLLTGISHVIRSTEFLPSVPRFLNLYEALDISPPILATPPVILGPEGKKKLSKRDGAKDILTYRQEGYLPEALINFMASLGWNDGTEQEIFSINELVQKFSLDRVQRSGAHFDERRLLWMSGHYIRQLDSKSLAERAEGFWPVEAKEAKQEIKEAILNLVQERLKYFGELSELSRFFFADPSEKNIRDLFEKPVDKQLGKIPEGERLEHLKAAQKSLGDSDFTYDDIKTRLNDLLKKLNTKPGVLFAVVRIAISGEKSTPELFGSLNVLGKEKSLQRIQKAVEVLERQT